MGSWLHINQSDMRRSTFQIGAALVESGKIAWICDEILVLINMDKVSFAVSKVHPRMGKIGFTESSGCPETRGKVVNHYHGTL